MCAALALLLALQRLQPILEDKVMLLVGRVRPSRRGQAQAMASYLQDGATVPAIRVLEEK